MFAEKNYLCAQLGPTNSPATITMEQRYPYYVCPAEYHHGWCGSHHLDAADAIAYRDQMERESGFEWRIINVFLPIQS